MIEQENIDYVVCKICGEKKKCLSKHIINKHNITVKKYKDIYKCEIECEKSKSIRANNRRNTIRKKYNVDNVSQLPQIKKKISNSCKQTCLEKYGCENVFQDEEIKKKARENRQKTLIDKYGTDNIMEIPEVLEKMTNTIKAMWNDKNSIYNSEEYGKFSNIEPNKAEKKILDMNIPKLVYTGNFSHWITFNNDRRKNPDFIIKPFSETKKVIELFGGKDFFHTKQEEKEIIELYKEVGVECLIIWDYELKNKNLLNVKNKILDFINN